MVGLVFVAAFAPDEGEALGEVAAGSKDSVLNTALVPLQYPTANGGDRRRSSRSTLPRSATPSPADLPTERRRVMAAIQRPVAEAAFSEPTGPPAWKTPAVVGRRRHRRPGRRDRPRPLDGRAGRARRSPRSTAPT